MNDEDIQRAFTTKQKMRQTKQGKGYFLDKKTHKTRFDQLMHVFQQYCSPEKMEELRHPYDTQTNEALNWSMATLAPKTKSFSTGHSLPLRICLCVCKKNLGEEEMIHRILHKMKIDPNENKNLLRNMGIFDDRKRKRTDKAKDKDQKLKRSKKI